MSYAIGAMIGAGVYVAWRIVRDESVEAATGVLALITASVLILHLVGRL